MTISYVELSNKIKNNSGLVSVLNVLDKAITYITVLLYALLLIYAFHYISKDGGTLLYRCILVPGVSFIIVSLFRKIASAQRPYEVYGFVPALKKDTKGKSFPSRHVFSIFMVAFTYFLVNIPIGIVLMAFGLVLGIIRVVGGVHFVRDVVAGALMAFFIATISYGIFCGVFGLLMLPF